MSTLIEFKKSLSKIVWLALTFFPIEDEAELIQLRDLLSPFLQNVRKCGKYDGNVDYERRRICGDIINAASSAVDTELVDRLNQVMIRGENGTINLEHDRLRGMNVRLFVNVNLFKISLF